MKRIFIYMAAASLLAACSKDDGIADAMDNTPEIGGTPIENPVAAGYTTYVEVATESGDSRATYNSDLTPLWEEGDKIVLHQMTAANGGSDANKSELPIKEGIGTSSAQFGAEITLPATGSRYFCFAYPAAAATFSTSDAIEAVGTIDYTYHQSTPGIGHYTATGTYKHTYTTSCNITIPTEQHGKWEPYMYAFTGESKPADNLGTFKFETLNGAICLRVKDTDKTTAKQLSEITISTPDGTPIAGTYVCTSKSEGTLEPLTGDEGKLISTSVNDQEGRDDARAKLEDKARAASPAAMTANSVGDWTLSNGQSEIRVSGLENIAKSSDGYYYYYINVAPGTYAQGLSITMKDAEGFDCKRTTKSLTLNASERKGYDIVWDEDVISLTFDENTGKLATSYSDYLAGNSAAANGKDAHTIYGGTIKGKLTLQGKYRLSDIAEYGLCVNGVTDKTYTKSAYYREAPASTSFEISFNNLTGLALGEYEYYLYVKDSAGNILAQTDHEPLYITGLPYACNVSQNDGWTLSGSVSFNSSYIELKNADNGSSIERNSFYIPEDIVDIKVIANSNFACRHGRSTSNTFSLYIGDMTKAKATHNGEYNINLSGGTDWFYNNIHHNFTGKGSLTKDNKSIKLHNAGTRTYCYTLISSFTLQYDNK